LTGRKEGRKEEEDERQGKKRLRSGGFTRRDIKEEINFSLFPSLSRLVICMQ